MDAIASLTSSPTRNPQAQAPDALGQQDFMRLLVAQMENQDPTKPMDNFQFLSQISQFGMVDGIQNLETSFDTVANGFRQNQLFEATNLIDRRVSVNSAVGTLTPEAPLEGSLKVSEPADNVVVEIRTQGSGELVFSSSLGSSYQGEIPFVWNGSIGNGVVANPGNYVVTGVAESGGARRALEVNTLNRVHGVTSNGNGAISLLLDNGEETDLASVKQFM